jgi:hypothetical protein
MTTQHPQVQPALAHQNAGPKAPEASQRELAQADTNLLAQLLGQDLSAALTRIRDAYSRNRKLDDIEDGQPFELPLLLPAKERRLLAAAAREISDLSDAVARSLIV